MTRILYYIPILLLLASCSNLKKLPAGDKLYTGATLKFTDDPKGKKLLRTELEGLIRPVPNRKILGMRIPLSLYNLAKPPKGKGLNYLLREKWGEPPVLLSKLRAGYTAAVLRNHLQNNGFFNATTLFETIETEKTARAVYTVHAGEAYHINKVVLPEDSSMVASIIRTYRNESVLKPGERFSLDKIKEERDRIDLALKEEGFFYFNPEYLLVEVDSSLEGKVDLYVTVKPETPGLARQPYHIKDVTIYPNYSLEKDSLIQEDKVRPYKEFSLVDDDSLFRPIVFDRSVFLKEDSIYRRSSHNITLRRLVSLGSFKFIRAAFERVPGKPLLNATLFLTPYPKRTIQLELNGNSKSNNFIGSEVSLRMINRNLMRGAEKLDISLGGGFENQVGGGTTQLSTRSLTLNGEVGLSFPRFISPFRIINPRTPFVPNTRMAVGYEILKRSGLYTLKAVRGNYGYNWKQNNYWEHIFLPLNFNYVLPSNITPEFEAILSQDLALRQSFEKQFIIGSAYTLRFSNQAETKRWNTSFADFNIDLSGNALGLLTKERNASGQKQLLGNPFSQYVRFTADLRNYWKLSEGATWANRFLLGYGFSYGNSEVMPFVKQYFIGGSNSIRAFRARTLGPGSYHSTSSQLLASEAGDVKLEMSTELRAKLFSVVNGAIFADAGNIWFRKENAQKPGSGLENWSKEIAVGAGAGLRFDASILVVRFDLAFPLRKPWYPEGNRWVLDEISFGDKQWRKENMVLNIAIGYPF